jgi:methylated-DNA-[protein]-cysteine S-methyltransferase
MIVATDEIDSPIGKLVLAAADRRLCALAFDDYAPGLTAALERRWPGAVFERRADPEGFSKRLRAYFDGDLGALDTIPVAPTGTEFQLRVWRALREIPCGGTRSYHDVAKAIGRPDAVRAVGAANGANPIAIVVPCHRVIGADGRLVGYGGGIERKRWLLTHEKALLA